MASSTSQMARNTKSVPSSHSPGPASSVNVEALAQAENAEARTVLSAMKERAANDRLAAQEAAEAARFPDPDPQRRYHRHHHQHRRKRSSAGGVSLPPAEPSPLKQAQLLRQRKENTAAIARAAVEKGSKNGGDGGTDGQPMPEAEVSEGGSEVTFTSSREAMRHAALQAVSESMENYRKSDSCSDWTRCTSAILKQLHFFSMDRCSMEHNTLIHDCGNML